MGYQHSVMRPCSGGDQQVVGTDGLALGGQVGTNLSCFLGAAIIKHEALQRLEEGLQKLQVGFDTLTMACAIEQP